MYAYVMKDTQKERSDRSAPFHTRINFTTFYLERSISISTSAKKQLNSHLRIAVSSFTFLQHSHLSPLAPCDGWISPPFAVSPPITSSFHFFWHKTSLRQRTSSTSLNRGGFISQKKRYFFFQGRVLSHILGPPSLETCFYIVRKMHDVYIYTHTHTRTHKYA